MSVPTARSIVVIGGGPAGLMAAGTIAQAGHRVDLYDAMPSVGRKFLLAGIGGLNLTHSEPRSRFVTRYGGRQAWIAPLLDAFDADTLRTWASDLGVATFVGSSGRVFPLEMKAAPLLRAWLHRLRTAGVHFHVRHRWLGWADDTSTPNAGLRFRTPDGDRNVSADAVVLALGGGSWARLGSDGAWVPWLRARGVRIEALKPANCGFDVAASTAARPDGAGWSDHFRQRFAGQALKSIAVHFVDHTGIEHLRTGECMITSSGLEGSLIYALSAAIRDTIAALGSVEISLDLAPNRPLARLITELARPRGSRSVASHLQSKAGIAGIKAGLLRECAPADAFGDPTRLAALIKALPVRLSRPRPLDEAISTAGGIVFEDVDEGLMIRSQPGLFCCGEMLDWEAPTGGYLLTACIASGHAAGIGVLNRLSTSD